MQSLRHPLFVQWEHFLRLICLLTIAPWLNLVLQFLCPQRNLDFIFACPHMFSIWVQHEGLRMGLGPFTMWQMVDYPNKRTNYLGFPSVPGHCREQQRAQQPDLPTVGQLAPSAAHTLPCLTSCVFIFPSLPFFHIFHCQLLVIPLPLGKVSVSPNRSWSGFASTQYSFFGFVLFRWKFVHGLDLRMI